MKVGFFSVEAISDCQFAGYSDGKHWNGWECPYFPFESAQQIALAVAEYETTFYDPLVDEFVFQGEGKNVERFKGVEFEFGKLYPIGTGTWIWERAKNEHV